MSYRFIKLSCDITKSTIWAEDDATLRLWIWLMASADRHGFIGGTIPGIASAARIAMDACERVLEKFEGPDRYSTNPSNEGRRVEKVEGGWRLLNYGYYRDRKGGDSEWQAERNRTKVAAFRERERQKKVEPVTGQCNREAVTDGNKVPDVTDLLPGVTTEAEAEAEAEPPQVQVQKQKAVVFILPDWIPSDLWADWLLMRKKIGKPATDRALHLAVKRLDQLRNDGHGSAAVLEQSILNSWQGLFELKQPKENVRNGFVKQSVTPGNIAACNAVLQRLDQGRGNPEMPDMARELLRAPDSGTNARVLPVSASGDDDRRATGRIQPSSAAVQILPPASRTASSGRMPDRRPTF